MRTSILTITVLLSIQYMSYAQNSHAVDSLKSIEQLYFMQGTWIGPGWIMKGRKREEFVQNEVINPKIDNTILVIDGIGHAKEAEKKIIHNAFGVISFNEEMNSMTMLSYSTAGKKMENKIKLTGYKKLEWSFKDERGGTIRFREDFSQEGLWIENGDYSADGVNWFPFFQMTLEKIKEL